MNTLPNEILVSIFSYFNTKSLIKLESVCTHWKNIVRTFSWECRCDPKSVKILMYLLEKYKFNKYDLRSISKYVDDKIIEKLKNGKYLNLTFCGKITDASVSLLVNAHTLDLSCCKPNPGLTI